jgi:hypothetical protein
MTAMKLSDHDLFHQDHQRPEQLQQLLQAQSQQLCSAVAKLPVQHRQQAMQQIQKQVKEVQHDAQQLCTLVSRQQQLAGQDPLLLRTAANISIDVLGLDDDAIEDESLGDDVSLAEGLKPEAEQQLRRVFTMTDTLSHQQVGRVLRRITFNLVTVEGPTLSVLVRFVVSLRVTLWLLLEWLWALGAA